MDTYYASRCPDCGEENLVYAGDTSDMTGFDPEAVKCWNCGRCWWITDDIDPDIEDLDEEFCDNGRRLYPEGEEKQ